MVLSVTEFSGSHLQLIIIYTRQLWACTVQLVLEAFQSNLESSICRGREREREGVRERERNVCVCVYRERGACGKEREN